MKKNLIVISCVLFLSNLVFADPAWPDSVLALVTDGFLQLDIWDENEVEQKSHQWGSNIYSIDLWHPVYGLMNSYKLQSATEQIDTKGLPFGVYIIVLKENGTIIANTKVLIK